MRRPGTEVAHMAHKIKDEGFNPFRQVILVIYSLLYFSRERT